MHSGTHIKTVFLFYCQNWELWKVLSTALAVLLSVILKVLFPTIGLLILVLIDTHFGVKKYIKKQLELGKQLKSERTYKNIQSEGLRKMGSKISDYLIFIVVFVSFESLVLEYMGINITHNNLTVSTVVVMLLCLVEIKSIDENMKKLHGISLYRSIVDFVFRRKSVSEIITEKDK